MEENKTSQAPRPAFPRPGSGEGEKTASRSSGACAGQLVVFSDDWGRHPSSCQHLVRHLLPNHPVLWVNTLGMRAPGFSREDLGKILRRLRTWMFPRQNSREQPAALPDNLRVLAPKMYPGFRTAWQRRFNARRIARAVRSALGPTPDSEVTFLTTLPITADLIDQFPGSRWLYYCVDDFSVWPGVDGPVMLEMEKRQVAKVHALVAASETLQDRLTARGRTATLLTHGIDLDHWATGATTQSPPDWMAALRRPVLLFWGLIDQRLDVALCRAMIEADLGVLVLAGPQQSPARELLNLAAQYPARLVLPGPVAYQELPTLAAGADVLVMPYADLPVTRAMQPLKFKEYLAAGWPDRFKPVVARQLPALTPWADAADFVADASALIAVLRERLASGIPPAQIAARQRLSSETWAAKAQTLAQVMAQMSSANRPL